MITQNTIEDTIFNLFKKAVIKLPDDVKKALQDAYENEDHEFACLNLKAILDNVEASEKLGLPMCQDTGLPIVFVKLGHVEVENLVDGIKRGVARATEEVPLRPNVVNPVTRINTGDNTGNLMPQVDIELVDDEILQLTAFPKGIGSENNNTLKMALPGEGIDGIKKFVLDTVIAAGGKPCPPIVVGIGIGGSSDLAMKLAKKALLSKIGERNPDKIFAFLEKEILDNINQTGIGPMGLGGKTTALDVKILTADTHTAGLPIGVCIQCWAARQATALLKP